MVHSNSIVHSFVELPEDAQLGAFVVIGELGRDQTASGPKTVIGRRAVIRSHSVVYAGNIIGDDFQTGHFVLVREENQIGNSVSVGTHSIIEHHVRVGDGVRIHSNAFIPEYSVLEEACWIGPCVVVTNARYPQSRRAKERLEGVHIGRHARIGAGAILLPGVSVGAGALIGAGAVVSHDVPPGAVVVGNPARIIKKVAEIEAYSE